MHAHKGFLGLAMNINIWGDVYLCLGNWYDTSASLHGSFHLKLSLSPLADCVFLLPKVNLVSPSLLCDECLSWLVREIALVTSVRKMELLLYFVVKPKTSTMPSHKKTSAEYVSVSEKMCFQVRGKIKRPAYIDRTLNPKTAKQGLMLDWHFLLRKEELGLHE